MLEKKFALCATKKINMADQAIFDKDVLEYLKPAMLKLVLLSSYIKSTKKTT
jgi:hypothetical protein